MVWLTRPLVREIREIRVLLNIEILYSFGWISIRGLYEYNDPSNNELSVFTGQQYYNIGVDP